MRAAAATPRSCRIDRPTPAFDDRRRPVQVHRRDRRGATACNSPRRCSRSPGHRRALRRRAGHLPRVDVERHGEQFAAPRVDDMAGRGIRRRGAARDQGPALPGPEIPEIDSRVVVGGDALETHRVDQRLAVRQQRRETVAAVAVVDVEFGHRFGLATRIASADDAARIVRGPVDPAVAPQSPR